MIRILDVNQYRVKLKATIQKSGRLGFTAKTAEMLALSTRCSVQLARDSEGDKSLYLILIDGSAENSLGVKKAGKYFYLPTKRMFDAFYEDYYNKVVIFDLIPVPKLDAQFCGKVYKMIRRELIRNKSKQKSGNKCRKKHN